MKYLALIFILFSCQVLASRSPGSADGNRLCIGSIPTFMNASKKNKALDIYRKVLPDNMSPEEVSSEVKRMSRLIDENTDNGKPEFENAFRHICQYYKSGDMSELTFIPKTMTKKTIERIKRAVDGGLCLGSLAALPQITLAFRQWRKKQRENGNHSWIVENGSNFVNGLRYMLVADSCSKAIARHVVHRNVILAIALGMNVAGNFWQEIQMLGDYQKSLPIFSSSGRVVQTDWKDFRAGIYATATYLVLIKAFEAQFTLPLDKICK